MPISPKIYAPLLKPAEISDAGTDIGEIKTWAIDTSVAPGSGKKYGLVITTKNNLDNPPPGPIVPDGHLHAEKIWNSVWNDYADFQLLADELIMGKCYYDTYDGAKICNERCQMASIGIASDTFAQIVGKIQNTKQVPIAVAGWVLAHVDKEYPCGTPLTNDKDGNLTEMSMQEKRDYPERMIGTYKRKELDASFGPENNKIHVNGRHWVKVK